MAMYPIKDSLEPLDALIPIPVDAMSDFMRTGTSIAMPIRSRSASRASQTPSSTESSPRRSARLRRSRSLPVIPKNSGADREYFIARRRRRQAAPQLRKQKEEDVWAWLYTPWTRFKFTLLFIMVVMTSVRWMVEGMYTRALAEKFAEAMERLQNETTTQD